MRMVSMALIAILASAAVAQSPPGSPNPAAVSGGVYTADPDHTLVVWTLDHLGFTPYTGMFGDVTGTLTIDPKQPNAARVDVTIPVGKVTTASAGLTQHLLRPGKDGGKPDFFGPTPANARFVSTKLVTSGQTAKLTGDFTFNGVTRPVTLDVTFYGAGKTPAAMGGKENIGFRATGSIKRSDFGLGFAVPIVGDEVKLEIAAAFQK
ncbi:YceI family protein [Sandarakinorhabdus rubra]|uniref:YceI family protein n=1 Tax=Sandarakinorhabdus rubra TaxID=2672568 RepID=UPI0013DCCE84|nr:YceI family protein [Sandarakinorhabdus rubra]